MQTFEYVNKGATIHITTKQERLPTSHSIKKSSRLSSMNDSRSDFRATQIKERENTSDISQTQFIGEIKKASPYKKKQIKVTPKEVKP